MKKMLMINASKRIAIDNIIIEAEKLSLSQLTKVNHSTVTTVGIIVIDTKKSKG